MAGHAAWALERELRGHTSSVRCCAWSPDGKWLASSSADGTVRVWDASTGREVAKLEEPGNRTLGASFSLDPLPPQVGDVNSCAWSPDGTRIAASSWDHTVRVWNVVGVGTALSAEELRKLRVKDLKVLLAGGGS